MVEVQSPPEVATRPPLRPRRRGKAGAAAGAFIVLGILAVGSVLVVDHLRSGRSLPTFPSLAAQPDASLQGTVAYLAGDGPAVCVRIVAASGQPSREVLCLPAPDMSQAAQLGTKEASPQLVWLGDGRLEVTVFRVDPKNGAYSAGWQKVVDVQSGQVVDTPAATVPSSPNFATRPTVSPTGQTITVTSNESDGRIKVSLSDANGSRTLLAAHGPGEYTYRLRAAFWAPNWQWIAADDGRILIITPGDPPVTRVLVDAGREGRHAVMPATDPRLASFAVTTANILSTSPSIPSPAPAATTRSAVPSTNGT